MKLPTITIPRIKITTLILCALCGYAAYEAGHKVGSLEAQADMQTLKKTNYAPKEYGMNELVSHVQSAQFIDLPQDLETLKQQQRGR